MKGDNRPPNAPDRTCDLACDGVPCDWDWDWDRPWDSLSESRLYSFLSGEPTNTLGEPTGCCDKNSQGCGWLLGMMIGCEDGLPMPACDECLIESSPKICCDSRSAFLRRASIFFLRLLIASSASRSCPGLHVMSSGSAPSSQRDSASVGSPRIVSDALMVAYLRRRRAAESPFSCSSSSSTFPELAALLGLPGPD